MIIKNRVAAAAAAVFMLAASAAAQAQSTLTVNVAGIGSFDEDRFIGQRLQNLQPGCRRSTSPALAYDVNLTAYGPSVACRR